MKVGESLISIYSLIQKDADNFFTIFKKQNHELYENIPIYETSGSASSSSSSAPAPSVSNSTTLNSSAGTNGKIIGHFVAKIKFVEDAMGLYLSMNPRVAGGSTPIKLSCNLIMLASRFATARGAVSGEIDDAYFKISNFVRLVFQHHRRIPTNC